ncbi:hypothetical protein ACH4TN_09390 [Streptomyces olivaceus]|uniref:hypothetical protein n=1 Tax=Streptomyces olivaceus TaxID=47716 RepID=UPI0037A0E5DB
MGGLAAALAGLPLLTQDPVHRGDRALVAPGAQLAGPDLRGRQLDVLARVHQGAAGQPAGGRDTELALDAGERVVGHRFGGSPQPAPSEIISKSAEALPRTSSAAWFRTSSFSSRSTWRRSFSFSASAADFFGLAGPVC